MARTPTPGVRQRILETASRLFGEHGVRAVGMQQLIDETGVGKSLLYREFPSKDDLVAAWMQESDAQWWRMAQQVVEPHAGDPVRQMLALIEFFYESARDPAFHGCIYYNTSSEFRDAAHPGRQEAVAHLRRVRGLMRDLSVQAEVADPNGLADSMMLIIAGLLANAEALGDGGPARVALRTAETVIRQYLPAPVAAAV